MTIISLPVVLPKICDLEPRATLLGRYAECVYAFARIERYGQCAAICEQGRHSFDRRAGNVVEYWPVESPTDAALIQAVRNRIGTMGAHRLWSDWCDDMAAKAKGDCTVEWLLRNASARKICWTLADGGKAYSADAEVYATRRVVRRAVDLLRDRAARRAARKVAQSAVSGGRIATIAAAKRAARRKAEDARTCDLVRAARKSLYRIASDAGKYALGSGHTTTVKIGTPGVSSDTSKVWGKQWSARASEHTYTVARTWIADVYDHDLAVCDGMLTLDASPISGHGPELFAALWVEQGRGTSLNQVRGYIARIDGSTYHAATAKAAIDGVQRKAGLKPARRKGTLDLDRLARRLGNLPVRFADSLAVGNCESGTLSWCHAMGLEPSGAAMLREIIRCYQVRPMEQVLRVIHRVVRDQRNRTPIAEPTVRPSALETDGRVVFDSEGGFSIQPSAN